MAPLGLTTKLEAVNQALASIGERPVSSIDETSRLDVVRALSTLDELNRLVQSRGWWFNRITDLTLTPASGEFILADNTLKILRLRSGGGFGSVPRALEKRYVLRRDSTDSKLKLYDKTNRTFTGNTEDLLVDLVEYLEFEDLPETARRYISTRSAVTFQARTIGSPSLTRFIEEEAREAWRELRREELEYEAEEGTLNTSPLVADVILKR